MESQHAPPPPPPPPPAPEAETQVVPAAEEEEPRKKKHSFWRELPVLIVIAFVVALLIKTYLLQAFYIPSASMEPTLVEGDRVLVEKLSYRWGEPERGDVVVFEKEFATLAPTHDDPFWEDIASALKGLFGFPTGGTQDFIKRVMAVEGDTIEGREGSVYVNGEVVEEPYLTEGTETSPFGPVEVPKDMIFVMGDNRGNSDDSRAFGPIPVDEVVGHAFLLLWPPSDFDTL
ncbi:MAG TPA: signal peptidase I [Actinomycetota bacterium]|nr:signal peptidase I [Actinomycetota bacterium]